MILFISPVLPWGFPLVTREGKCFSCLCFSDQSHLCLLDSQRAIFGSPLVWVSEGRISSFWISYNPFTADLAMSLRDIKNPYLYFVPKFSYPQQYTVTFFVFQGNVKFALDFIGICEVWGNNNTSLFFEFTYVLGMKTKLYHPVWEWCHTNIASTFHQDL